MKRLGERRLARRRQPRHSYLVSHTPRHISPTYCPADDAWRQRWRYRHLKRLERRRHNAIGACWHGEYGRRRRARDTGQKKIYVEKALPKRRPPTREATSAARRHVAATFDAALSRACCDMSLSAHRCNGSGCVAACSVMQCSTAEAKNRYFVIRRSWRCAEPYAEGGA